MVAFVRHDAHQLAEADRIGLETLREMNAIPDASKEIRTRLMTAVAPQALRSGVLRQPTKAIHWIGAGCGHTGLPF